LAAFSLELGRGFTVPADFMATWTTAMTRITGTQDLCRLAEHSPLPISKRMRRGTGKVT
jgi:hypothetical protein